MRSIVMFAAGFASGMLFLTLLLWSRGSLEPVRAAVPTASTNPIGTPPPPPEPPPIEHSLEPGIRPRGLIVPVENVRPSSLLDTFTQERDGRAHEAIDIMAPRGTPVIATDDGTVEKLFASRPGGLTIYQFDPTRTWCYYYAHLDHYAYGLKEGMQVRKGQVLGYVGSTGNASPAAPHVHFAIFKLGPDKRWWEGVPINPYPILAVPGSHRH
jgi:murein DD-endopeptidase MepM/ murein hydrolase activator NlpD